jgi:hypothetical protein
MGSPQITILTLSPNSFSNSMFFLTIGFPALDVNLSVSYISTTLPFKSTLSLILNSNASSKLENLFSLTD